MSPLFVQCGGCDGEGRVLEAVYVYDRGCGYSYPDVADAGPCPYCQGFGSEEVAGEPITLEDLDSFVLFGLKAKRAKIVKVKGGAQ